MIEHVSFQFQDNVLKGVGILCFSEEVLSSYCFWSSSTAFLVFQILQLRYLASEICLCNGLLVLLPGHLPGDDYVSHPLKLGLLLCLVLTSDKICNIHRYLVPFPQSSQDLWNYLIPKE